MFRVPRYLLSFSSEDGPVTFCDVLVIGSGVAGLTTALEASKDFDVVLLTKDDVAESATWHAQGGVASALGEEDSPRLHEKDTLEAGAGLCDKTAVRVLAEEGPVAIEHLLRLGAEFDWLGDKISLAREGGHSLARIIHSGDATGTEIESTLIRVAERWRSVALREHVFVADLITHRGRCVGAVGIDRATGRKELWLAPVTVLASGGAGQIFRVTTNPEVATGDGVAMAYRAGAAVRDMEFIQFHPTALDFPETPRLLITEALRGDGAHLVDAEGRRFMKNVHVLAELAPRDVVSRAMVQSMSASGEGHVFLDARHIGTDRLKARFPNVWQGCLSRGFDLGKMVVPVVPAAHYTIGGVVADADGRTTLRGLFACGEVACTGVHGANRLASNSLLEGLVFSRRVCRALGASASDIAKSRRSVERLSPSGRAFDGDIFPEVGAMREGLRRTMTDQVGLARSKDSLKSGERVLQELAKDLEGESRSVAALELTNMVQVAGIVCDCAARRTESRGCHYRSDFPDRDDAHWLKHATLRARGRLT